MAGLFCLGFSACSKEKKEQTDKDVKIWSAVNSEKILQTGVAKDTEAKLSFHTLKGDIESAQFIFTPSKHVSSFNFTMNDVKTESGETIPSSAFEVYAEKYITVRIPTSRNTIAGNYPDAIVPIKNYIAKREANVEEGKNQGVWVNLNVPKTAKAGEYQGSGTLTLDGTEYKIPIYVKIYDLEMPENIHTVSSFYLDTSMIGLGENMTATEEMKETYYLFMRDKRACVRNIPKYESVNVRYKFCIGRS